MFPIINLYIPQRINKPKNKPQKPLIKPLSEKTVNRRTREIPIQDLDKDLFFIKMYRYDKNELWAQKVNELTYKCADLISAGESFDVVSEFIKRGLKRINKNTGYCEKKNFLSHFRIYRYGRGKEYFDIYKKICDDFTPKDVFDTYQPKGHEKTTNVCKIDYKEQNDRFDESIRIHYGCNFAQEHSNLEIVKKVYNKIKRKKNPTKEQINFATAKIQWLIAQETPFTRGNDSYANILTRAIYISKGYKVSPVKSGKSLDFEAFYRNLDDYIKAYPAFFEIEPYKIND